MADDGELLGAAETICAGGATDVATVARLAGALRAQGRHDVVSRLLIEVACRALYHDWERPAWSELADVLQVNQQFGYARRVLRRLHDADPGALALRRRYAFCVFADGELPAVRRLDRALDLLGGPDALRTSGDLETLALAGAVYQRKWDVEARRGDLESARFCYLRGREQAGQPGRERCAVAAALVLDQLAALDERDALGDAAQAAALREHATALRLAAVEAIAERRAAGGEEETDAATLGEACFGLERFAQAAAELRAVRARDPAPWELQALAMRLAGLARLRRFGADISAGSARTAAFSGSDAGQALRALLGDDESALRRAYLGKLGLALSGGGFRASLFHIGVLAKLAEFDLLRRVEVLSCVSGGSILGAFYYLRLRELLQRTPDEQIDAQDYVDLVRRLADDFLDSVRQNLRVRLTTDLDDNFRMVASSDYSRTDRVVELLDELIYAKVDNGGRPWRMTDLLVNPAGRERGFSPRYENWRRASKVPVLVLNATTLNTGHSWQFTASWMGEPPLVADEQVDANSRLRRMYYADAPGEHRETRLAHAVAASACVPTLFPPLRLAGLFDGLDVELVDGGVHDNQGVASLLEQDCNVVLVSDASGQMGDLDAPSRHVLGVANRANSILMSRVRGAQYGDLVVRRRAGSLRRLMIVHLKKGLPARPRDWHGCPERYDPEQDEIPAAQEQRRAGYRIAEDVQRGLAGLRTDLDAFSDDEAYALMAAGYRMVEYELPLGLPDFPLPERPPAPAGGWPFARALEVIATPGALEITLAVGRERFLRRPRTWLARRRARPPGALSRLLARTPLGAVPSVARRAVRTVVVVPLRALVGAPVAAAAALATRGYLRVFGRRRGPR